jgi:hypothetical protein
VPVHPADHTPASRYAALWGGPPAASPGRRRWRRPGWPVGRAAHGLEELNEIAPLMLRGQQAGRSLDDYLRRRTQQPRLANAQWSS